jgi:hypothetical protein
VIQVKWRGKAILLGISVLLLSLTQWQCLLIPEDKETGERVPNKRPFVRITGGVFSSDTTGVEYRVLFRWHGWDDDGVVTAFEWAIDDTTLESAWHTTQEFSGLFKFSATTPDPNDPRFYDWHTFFIRAIDNEFARSELDSRFFNARTIAPETKITFPEIRTSTHLRLPSTFNLTWEGEDLDSSKPEKTPEYYEYKLVRLLVPAGNNDIYVDSLLNGVNVFLDTLTVGDKTRWIRVPGTVTELRLTELPSTGLGYVVGVRAVDEAGAVEPTLEFGVNYIPFEVTQEPCRPVVTVTEVHLGSHVFDSNAIDRPWEVDVPAGTPLRFEWTGDAEGCGTRPGNVNYALDIEDPGDESDRAANGIGGWIGWGLWPGVQTPIVFPERDDGKIHNLYIKMRDETNDPRSERFCWIQMKVVAFPMNRTALVVDDATPPRAFASDPVHDARRDLVLSCIEEFLEPGESIDYFNMYSREQGHQNPQNPRDLRLEIISQYKAVFWNSFFYGRNSSGLNRNERNPVGVKILTLYVGAGGSLYLFGSQPIGALAGDNYQYGGYRDGLCPDVSGVEGPAWDKDDFIWKFLHIRNCVFAPLNDRLAVDGWVGAHAVHPNFPDIRIDRTIWDPDDIGASGLPKGGTGYVEYYRAKSGVPIVHEAGLDTIYIAETYNYAQQVSLYDGSPCALRFEPTAEDSARGLSQGRVFLQMFDFLFTDLTTAQELGCKVVSWIMTGRDE